VSRAKHNFKWTKKGLVALVIPVCVYYSLLPNGAKVQMNALSGYQELVRVQKVIKS
jgi:hypothetical protein